ncbi:MAG TPA: hypothetical protein VGB14_12530 [Acidimicrobiales bacterium]|jgi:hypothetical protein
MPKLGELFGFSPASVLTDLVAAVSSSLVGRRVRFRAGGREVALSLLACAVDPPTLGPLVGQYGTVTVAADDVAADPWTFRHLTVLARNAHVQPGEVPVLVAAPVEVRVLVGRDEVDRAVARVTGRLRVVVGDDAVARAHLADHADLGHVEVEPVLDGGSVRLATRSVVVRGSRRFVAGARLVPRPAIPLPVVPGLHVTEVALAPGGVRVAGVVEEWRAPIRPAQLDRLVRQVRSFTGAALDLSPFRPPA